MIKYRMKQIKLIFLLFVLFTAATPVYAQFGGCDPETDPFCDPEGNPSDPFEPIPIDGGALALLAGGAALGYKALKKKKEENSEE